MTDTPKNAADRNASSPRFFWVGMAVFLTVMVLLGFGSTYGRQLVLGLEISGVGVVETDWVIHLHAAVFVGWLAFLLTQVTLVARGRTRTHMTLGGYVGLGLAVAILVAGGIITYAQMRAAVAEGLVTWSETPLMNPITWASLLAFVLLLGLGLLNRTRPEVHKRYMMFATMTLALAAASRMEYLLGPRSNTIGAALMVAPVLGYDLYAERRVRPASLIGTAVMTTLLVIHYLT